MSLAPKTINILGVTGSIGQSAQDVILANKDAFDVNLITAHNNESDLNKAAQNLSANKACLSNTGSITDALDAQVDITLCAIMGMAGLESMLKAIETSKAVLIANKEPLVSAGDLVIQKAREHGTVLLPVDSEHNAIFQVFNEAQKHTIERIILTASGGPFLSWSMDEMRAAKPEQALKHPNWEMGRKISIDSATMMNKALEIIEAHYLFNMPADQIEVIIHPQSIVHSMVEYNDGSVLAQMGANDMRTPLANVMHWPKRLPTPGHKLDFTALSALNFKQPDTQQFPAIDLAYKALKKGHSACVAMNAANEIAVDAFLNNTLGFLDIVETVTHIVDSAEIKTLDSLVNILDFDANMRQTTLDYIKLKQTVPQS